MPLLDDQLLSEQRGMQKTGDLRTGIRVPDNSKVGSHPKAIETFRFTSRSRFAISRVAEQLGGDPCEWMNDDGHFLGWQVTTERDVVAVLVPPNQVITQDYEMWRRNTLVRRCDSQTMAVPAGKPCECPHAEDPADVDEVLRCARLRDEQAKRGDACARYTRLCVQIPSLPDIGVWRLTTGGLYAAGELAKKAEILQTARAAGAILPALLRLEPRQRPARPGEPGRRYVVPVLELLNSVQEILSEQIPASLPAAMEMLLERAAEVIAIETAPSSRRAALPAGRPAATPEPAPAADEPPLPEGPTGGEPDDADDRFDEDWQRAQRIYDRAVASTNRADLEACGKELTDKGLGDAQVCTDRDPKEIWEPSIEAWRALWRQRVQGVA